MSATNVSRHVSPDDDARVLARLQSSPLCPLPRTHAPRVLVLDGHTRAAVATARSVGRAGCVVEVAGIEDAASARSRYAVRHIRLPDADRGDLSAYSDALIGYLRRNRPDILFASTDASLAAIMARRAEIDTLTRLGLASQGALAAAVDKSVTLRIADDLGVPRPAGRRVTTGAAARAAAEAVGYPCVVKPCESWSDAHDARVVSTLVTSVDELNAVTRDLGEQSAVVVQHYLPGRREAVSMLRIDGRVLAAFGMAASRTWPPLGGNSVMRTAIPVEPALRDACEALLAAIGYEGYAEIEWRRDASGVARLMEINARFSQSIELATRAGVDFPALYAAALVGGRVDPVLTYRIGTRLSWLGGEMHLVAAAARRNVRGQQLAPLLTEIARDYMPPPAIDGFDLRDPAPALRSVANALAGLFRTPRT